MRQLRQFYILKFESDRLKENNYKIKQLNIDDARLNGELVSIANSQMVRTIFRETGREFSEFKLDELLTKKRKLKNKRNSFENRKKLKEVLSEIDKILFIPEIISVKFNNKKHYKNILYRNGFMVNGKTYLPFLFSAGMIRRNSGLFIESSLKEKITKIFDNDRNKDVEIVPAKYNSYLALYTSSSFEVTFPRIAVVPDLIIKKIKNINLAEYQEEGVDPLIENVEQEIEFNAFDGCGLVSPQMANSWSYDLELDYTASTFLIRCSFLKGMCVTFPFHEFAEEIAKQYIIKDVYGNEIDIRDIDIIVSPSMFKLWDSYENTESYIGKCKKNNIDFGISKVNPKTEKNFCKTSYQFLQVLNLNDNQIESLSKSTLNWLDFASGGELNSTLLYFLGEKIDISGKWMEKLEPVYQALILENSLIKDSFLISHLERSLSKKKNDSKKGSLILNGNYQVIIPDLYLYACHIFGIELNPLLKEGECYSYYWNKKGVKKVAAIRSPIVHSSEVNVLNLKNSEELEYWYKWIKSGIIFPANGVGMDCAINGGADFDSDLIATINSREIIDGRIEGLPILYNIEKAEKSKINSDNEYKLYDSQMQGFGTKVGYYTNISSTYYSLLYDFDENSKEYKVIQNRLKWGRALQGLEIDKQKGLLIPSFPEHWVKWKKVTDDMQQEEKDKIYFNNKILADKRPYFFIYLYPHYMRRYRDEQLIYNNISTVKWGLSFSELKELENRTEEQEKLLKSYRRNTFFIDNNSVMNRICHYMEDKLRDSKIRKRKESEFFYPNVLFSKGFSIPSKDNIEKMRLLYKEYKSLKRNVRDGHFNTDKEDFVDIEQISIYINNKAHSAISSNSSELADIAVYLCYFVLGKNSRSFAWSVFGKEIVSNVFNRKENKTVKVPFPDENGNIDYLWNRYSEREINIEDQFLT